MGNAESTGKVVEPVTFVSSAAVRQPIGFRSLRERLRDESELFKTPKSVHYGPLVVVTERASRVNCAFVYRLAKRVRCDFPDQRSPFVP